MKGQGDIISLLWIVVLFLVIIVLLKQLGWVG